MITEWSRQELQFGVMIVQSERYLTTFRWLWLLNLAAAIVGVVTHRYELMIVAAGSSFIALIGVAFARIGRKTVSAAASESQRIQRKLDPLR